VWSRKHKVKAHRNGNGKLNPSGKGVKETIGRRERIAMVNGKGSDKDALGWSGGRRQSSMNLVGGSDQRGGSRGNNMHANSRF